MEESNEQLVTIQVSLVEACAEHCACPRNNDIHDKKYYSKWLGYSCYGVSTALSHLLRLGYTHDANYHNMEKIHKLARGHTSRLKLSMMSK